jgi:hypothetical protein
MTARLVEDALLLDGNRMEPQRQDPLMPSANSEASCCLGSPVGAFGMLEEEVRLVIGMVAETGTLMVGQKGNVNDYKEL